MRPASRRPRPTIKRSRSTARPQAKKPHLVAVIGINRHESVGGQARLSQASRFGIRPLVGIHADRSQRREHSLGIGLSGEARSLRQGERMVEAVLKSSNVARQLKKRGVVVSTISSPLVRAIETGNMNQQGINMRLRDKGIPVHANFSRTNANMAITTMAKGLAYYPKEGSRAEKKVMKQYTAWSQGKKQKGWESRTDGIKRARVVKDIKQQLMDLAKAGQINANEPVPFLNFTGHGGVAGIAGDIDFAAMQATGLSKEKMGGRIARGEGLVQLLFSNGKTKTVMLKKGKTLHPKSG